MILLKIETEERWRTRTMARNGIHGWRTSATNEGARRMKRGVGWRMVATVERDQ